MSVEERPDPVPGRFEVVIAPPFAGVNPADVLQREGRHPVPAGSPSDVPGLEVAGPVVAIGEGVSSLAVGDRAFGLVGGGGQAELVLAQERELVVCRKGSTTARGRGAAVLPDGLRRDRPPGLVGAGDVLLVNGGNGGVGMAAVQIAPPRWTRGWSPACAAPELRAKVAALGRRGARGRGCVRRACGSSAAPTSCSSSSARRTWRPT